MKLHLPVRLFRAVAALFSLGVGIASSCHISSAAVPEGYKEIIIATEGDLTNMEPTLGNHAFLVKADLLFDKLPSPFMSGTAVSWYFSGLSAMSIAFEKASYSAFYVADDQSLTFAEFREVDFSENKVSISSNSANNANAAGSAIYGADTIELSDNVSVVFSGNSASASSSNYIAYAWGGAVCGNTSTITLSKNKNLTFSGNTVSASSVRYYAYAWGSAIYGSVITLNENEDVTFSGNAASSSATLRNSARDSDTQGGAICGSTITLSKNKSLTFSENSAYASSSGNSSSYKASAAGGVIFGDKNITLSENESVVFSGNTVFSTSNSTNTATQALGGAIYGWSNSTITLSKNGSVEFSGNTVSTTTENYSTDNPAYGGAIYGGSNSTITLSNNESVTFSGNAASSTSLGSITSGGAIYGGSQSTIELSNNEIVTFSENTASYLGSSYAELVSGGAIHGNKITLNGNGSVELCKNAVYNSSGKNDASAKGGAIEGSSITLSENDRVLFSENSASSSVADGGAIFCTSLTVNNNEVVVFSKNTVNSTRTLSGSSVITRGGAICVNRGTIMLRDNGKVEFSGNEVSSLALTACGGAICGDYNSTITLRNNDSVEFRGNTGSSTSDYAFGGAIYGSTITLSMNGSVEFSGNTANGDGGAIYVLNGNSTVLSLSGNGSVTFNGNTASYGGGAIYAGNGSSIKLNENRSVTFSENTAYSGSAILASGNLSIRNNDFVLFEKNADVTNGTYRLRSISAGGSGDVISLSAAASGSIEFRDSVYIAPGSTVDLNADYTDAKGVVHKQTGDIIFTGATTEADLLAVKGSAGTAEEIQNSRTSVMPTANLYGGRLRIEDGAILQVDNITVADDSYATVVLKDGTINGGLTIGATGTLYLSGENTIQQNTNYLTMAEGSCMQMNLGAVNIDGNAVLTINGLNTGNFTLHLVNSEYLATGDYKLIASTEACDISGWTLRGAEANQLTWENGTLYYKGGYDWNHVVKGGDEVRDSYAGNLIVNGGTVTLEKSVSVNAIDGVEKTGHLVINKGNLHVTAESNVRGDVMVKEGGALLNDGSIENCITLSGGKVSGSGVFAGIDMSGGKLVVGNSPGIQSYTDTANLTGGTVVFSVAGTEAASLGNSGWASGTYSTIDMMGNTLTFGADVSIEIALGGEALVSVLNAATTAPQVLQLSLARNIGNASAYTQEVLSALEKQTTFIVTTEADGIGDCVTLTPGTSLAAIVQSFSYSMSGNTLVLNISMAGNGMGITAVPEPTTATLSLLALAALAARRRRK